MLSEESFDGVLMDCQMPVMDGYEATRLLRKQEKYKDLPVIAMTANVMAGDRDKVLGSGMNDHIGKPINVREMFTTMARWITPSEPHADLPVQQSSLVDESSVSLMDLPGIDTAAGLATTQGNEKLYRKLLLKFRDSQRDFGSTFIKALASDDPCGAERVAHTLKGVAGNIGAKGVQAAAQNLEQACKEGIEDKSPLLNAVLAELDPVIGELDEHHSALEVTSATGVVDKEKANELVTQLRELLEDDDTDAVDVLDELLSLFVGRPSAKALNEMSKLIEAYEYDAALELIDKIDIG